MKRTILAVAAAMAVAGCGGSDSATSIPAYQDAQGRLCVINLTIESGTAAEHLVCGGEVIGPCSNDPASLPADHTIYAFDSRYCVVD